jgi:cytochrome c-type biogenesis protein CcmH/NrfG
MLAGDSQGARESAARALRLDSRRFEASRVLGEAYLQDRDYEGAIPPLKQALQAQPQNVSVHLLLGTAYSQTGRDQEALPLLESVLERGYPDEKGRVHYVLGTVLRRLGRGKDADQAFEQAEQLSETFARLAHKPAESQ